MDAQAHKQLQALANPVRSKLLQLIAQEARYCDPDEIYPYSNNHLSGLLKSSRLSKSTLSHHLQKLIAAGLLRTQKHGRLQLLWPDLSGLAQLQVFLQELLGISSNFATSKPEIIRIFRLSAREAQNPKDLLDFLRLQGYSISRKIAVRNPWLSRYYVRSSRQQSRLQMRLQLDAKNSHWELAAHPEATAASHTLERIIEAYIQRH